MSMMVCEGTSSCLASSLIRILLIKDSNALVTRRLTDVLRVLYGIKFAVVIRRFGGVGRTGRRCFASVRRSLQHWFRFRGRLTGLRRRFNGLDFGNGFFDRSGGRLK